MLELTAENTQCMPWLLRDPQDWPSAREDDPIYACRFMSNRARKAFMDGMDKGSNSLLDGFKRIDGFNIVAAIILDVLATYQVALEAQGAIPEGLRADQQDMEAGMRQLLQRFQSDRQHDESTLEGDEGLWLDTFGEKAMGVRVKLIQSGLV